MEHARMAISHVTSIPRARAPARAAGRDPRDAVLREHAGEILHHHLVRCARADANLDRAIGRTLRRLRGIDGPAKLGFARFSDYLRERTGLGARWAQKLMRLDEALENLPVLSTAHRDGRLTTSKVLALLPVATPKNEGGWCRRARELTVRGIEAAAREAMNGSAGDEAAAAGAGGSSVTPAPADDDAADERIRLRIDVPAPMIDLFDHAIEVARRAIGDNEPVHRCFEYLLAEFLAGPVGANADAAGPEPTGVAPASDSTRPTGPGENGRPAFSHDPGCRPDFHRWLANGCALGPDDIPRPGDGGSGEDLLRYRLPPDPLVLDAHLRRLLRLRQRRHGEMASLLSNCQRLGLPRKAGFTSFGHYCREALGISPRLAYDLVFAYRRFFDLNKVGNAYWNGEITWSQARCLLGVCRPDTQTAWISRAREVTVRRLELEARHVRRLKEVDPESWVRDGGPPPLSTLPPRAVASAIRPGAGLWETPATAVSAQTCSHGAMRRLQIRVQTEVLDLWRDARQRIERAAGRPVLPWQSLLVVLADFLDKWDNPRNVERPRGDRILTRDGYQCTAPGCGARKNLEIHHIVRRSRGGSDDPSNLTTLCVVHHRHVLHGGWMRATGTAPDHIVWETLLATYTGDVVTAGDPPCASASNRRRHSGL
jgi:hypothetical protein